MFNIFKKRHQRVTVQDNNIYIDNSNDNIGKSVEVQTVLAFTQPTPEITVFENNKIIHRYSIETLETNPDLAGQFLHSSIRILGNSAVMIDGIISRSHKSCPEWTDDNYEAVRLQPFFLSNANEKNIQLIGKGLFDRGLHFSGTVTPGTVRCVCICDHCKQSFSLQHFHAGFSEVQYFYSSGSRETLIVPYNALANMPTQLQEYLDPSALEEVENRLTASSDGKFRYFNSFKCPHCLAAFIDFERYPEMRPGEYYGNTLLNQKPKQWADQSGER